MTNPSPQGETAARVALEGELTVYTVAEVKETLAKAMESADDIEVDLSGVSEVDTAGVQLMLIAKRSAGKRIVFSHHPAAVLRLIDLAGLASALGDLMVVDAAQS
jgi:anti-anti-sigma factor